MADIYTVTTVTNTGLTQCRETFDHGHAFIWYQTACANTALQHVAVYERYECDDVTTNELITERRI